MSSSSRDGPGSGSTRGVPAGDAPAPANGFAAQQIRLAVGLRDALDPKPGSRVLVVNPPLANPRHLQVLRDGGCAVTALGSGAGLMKQVRGEHEALSSGDAGRVRFRVGEVNLFFPEEDSFDVVCLMSVAKGEWGLGPEALLHNSLRGLREGGTLLWGVLGVALDDPDWVVAAAGEAGFRLTAHPAGRVPYAPYAPDGSLFVLEEKTARRVGLEVFTRASADLGGGPTSDRDLEEEALDDEDLDDEDLDEEDLDDESLEDAAILDDEPVDPAVLIEEAVALARRLGVHERSRILAVGRTPDLWTERVLAGVAGRIDILVDEGVDLAEARAEFCFYPGLAALRGGLQLQGALRNPRNRLYGLSYLRPICSLKTFDLICLAAPDRGLEIFRTCVAALAAGGRILVRAPEPGDETVAALEEAAAAEGRPLRFERSERYGPVTAALFSRI
jgi:SAM-dependent methyltransferase